MIKDGNRIMRSDTMQLYSGKNKVMQSVDVRVIRVENGITRSDTMQMIKDGNRIMRSDTMQLYSGKNKVMQSVDVRVIRVENGITRLDTCR